MVKVYIRGLTGGNMTVNGRTEGNTEMENMYLKMDRKKKGSGSMEKEKNGLMNDENIKNTFYNNFYIF